jgi:DNA-directed RNA polymerase subunit RPC12/RpoP
MINCPRCGTEVKNNPYKQWEYTGRKVFAYKCQKCRKGFRYYVPVNGKPYTIPKSEETY